MLDFNIANIAKEEYEERLKQAELYRRVRQQSESQPEIVERALLGISQFLIDTGLRLKHRVEMRPGLS
jgi:hypothetical protein